MGVRRERVRVRECGWKREREFGKIFWKIGIEIKLKYIEKKIGGELGRDGEFFLID